MGWTSTQNGGYALASAASREVYVFAVPIPATAAVICTINDCALGVGVMVYTDQLGANCWEAYPTAGTGGNYAIRRVTFGVPAAPVASAAHGLTTGDNYRVQVRIVGGVISVYLNASTTPVVTHDTAGDLNNQTRFGFSGSTAVAYVSTVQVFSLQPSFVGRAEVFWAVIGGMFYASEDGRGLRYLAAGFHATNDVIGAENGQHAYITDGVHAFDFDAVAMTVTAHLPSAGTLPGQDAAGSTTSRWVAQFNNRLIWEEEQNAKASSILDVHDMLTGTGIPGAAFEFQGSDIGTVGEPIIGTLTTQANAFIMLGRGSLWMLTGDPILGGQILPIGEQVGAAGGEAICLGLNAQVYVLTVRGLAGVEGNALNLISESVLTTYIQVPSAVDDYRVQMRRDVDNAGLWMFFTRRETGQSTHIFMSERTGGYYPQRFDDINGPTASCVYDNKVLLGTRDGRILSFQRAPALMVDAAGGETSPVECRMAVSLVRSEDLEFDTRLYDMHLVRAEGAGNVTLRVWGGASPEAAFEGTRWLLWENVLMERRSSFLVEQRSPALVLEASSSGGAPWALEAFQIDTVLEPLIYTERQEGGTASTPAGPDVVPVVPSETPGTGGPGAGTTPPAECVDCAVWMATNYSLELDMGSGLEKAYTLVGGNTLTGAQAELAANKHVIEDANLCGLSSFNIFVVVFDGPDTVPAGVQTIAAFNALVEDPMNPYKLAVYFGCSLLVVM